MAWNSDDWTFDALEAHYKTLVRYINFNDAGMVLGYGCGTPGMTKRSRYPQEAYQLGMLKTTIDRFLPKWQELGGHDVYLIITGHDGKDGLKLVRDEMSGIFQNLGNEIRGIIWGENVWQKGEVKTTKAMEEAYQAGLNI